MKTTKSSREAVRSSISYNEANDCWYYESNLDLETVSQLLDDAEELERLYAELKILQHYWVDRELRKRGTTTDASWCAEAEELGLVLEQNNKQE